MRITKAPREFLGFQYQLMRRPLQLIEERVIARMAAEAPTRLFYERSLGLLDATIGNVLGDSTLKKHGSALAERGDYLSRAARLDAAATAKDKRAAAELKEAIGQAAGDQQQVRESKQHDIRDARARAEQRKGASEKAAEKRIVAMKRQADEADVQRKSSVQDVKRREENRIRADEQKASAAAQSKLDDAQAKRSDAAAKRVQADEVEQLAGVERRNRQAARVRNS